FIGGSPRPFEITTKECTQRSPRRPSPQAGKGTKKDRHLDRSCAKLNAAEGPAVPRLGKTTFDTLAPMSDLAPLIQVLEYSSRLEFLYKIVEDTQNTIRFIDTKAAFCLTLLSAMAAGALQRPHQPTL